MLEDLLEIDRQMLSKHEALTQTGRYRQLANERTNVVWEHTTYFENVTMRFPFPLRAWHFLLSTAARPCIRIQCTGATEKCDKWHTIASLIEVNVPKRPIIQLSASCQTHAQLIPSVRQRTYENAYLVGSLNNKSVSSIEGFQGGFHAV